MSRGSNDPKQEEGTRVVASITPNLVGFRARARVGNAAKFLLPEK